MLSQVLETWEKGLAIGIIITLIGAIVYGVKAIERITKSNSETVEKISEKHSVNIENLSSQHRDERKEWRDDSREERNKREEDNKTQSDRLLKVCDEVIKTLHQTREKQ